ncbi:hypothetical protein XANCAGTX0491_009351 [Xanthoria calcicola]
MVQQLLQPLQPFQPPNLDHQLNISKDKPSKYKQPTKNANSEQQTDSSETVAADYPRKQEKGYPRVANGPRNPPSSRSLPLSPWAHRPWGQERCPAKRTHCPACVIGGSPVQQAIHAEYVAASKFDGVFGPTDAEGVVEADLAGAVVQFGGGGECAGRGDLG